MSFFRMTTDLIGDLGIGVIKHSGRIALGGGKTIIGALTEDEDLIADGLSQAGKGAVGLGLSVVGKTLLNNDDSDVDVDCDC